MTSNHPKEWGQPGYIEEQIRLTQREIASLLAMLERNTGMLVKNLSIQSINVTTESASKPQHQQSVEIEMFRLPGHHW